MEAYVQKSYYFSPCIPVRMSDIDHLPKHRIEALSDGVYAIVLTLAVLNITIDPNIPLNKELDTLFIGILDYAIVFLVLIRFWISNHISFNRVKHVDETMIFLCLASLFFVALVPASMDILFEYGDSSLPVAIFAALNFMLGLLSTTMVMYSYKPDIIREDVDPSDMSMRCRVPAALTALSLVIIFTSLVLNWDQSLYIYILGIPISYLMRKMYEKEKKSEKSMTFE